MNLPTCGVTCGDGSGCLSLLLSFSGESGRSPWVGHGVDQTATSSLSEVVGHAPGTSFWQLTCVNVSCLLSEHARDRGTAADRMRTAAARGGRRLLRPATSLLYFCSSSSVSTPSLIVVCKVGAHGLTAGEPLGEVGQWDVVELANQSLNGGGGPAITIPGAARPTRRHQPAPKGRSNVIQVTPNGSLRGTRFLKELSKCNPIKEKK